MIIGGDFMQNRGVLILGLILIVAGILGLLSGFGVLSVGWGQIWPLFLVIPGLLFEFGFFLNGRRDPGLLVPGGILLTYGILFAFCSAYGFSWMGKLWPFFLLGPAIGIFQIYLFGTHDKSLLIPVGILGGLSLIFLLANLTTMDIGSILFPVILIIVGIVILLHARREDKNG